MDVLIYGAGGHALVIAEAIHESLGYNQIGMFDDSAKENLPAYVEFLGKYHPNIFPDLSILIGVGNNKIRAELAQKIKHKFFTFIHPSASVAASVWIGEGSVILQHAIVQSNSSIQTHSILNASSLVDHDCHIGSFSHIEPMAYVGSNSNLQDFSLIPANSTIPRFSSI